MKPFLTICALAPLFLAGCMTDGSLPGTGSASRYDIDSYQEETALSSDLTGLWIVIHNGTLKEKVNGVDYTISGNIREIVEITRTSSVYYLRTCLQPETKHVMSVSGSAVSGTVNDETVELTAAGNTAMSGTASHSITDSSYSGSVKMKKVAALDDTFGLFSFLNTGETTEVATASCFQEASLHVVGSQMLFSKWADVELANVTDWSNTAFRQTGHLFSRAGTADPVKQVRFADGSAGNEMTAREYPLGDESITIAVAESAEDAYSSDFSVSGVVSGSIELVFDFAVPAPVATPAEPAGSSTSLPADTTSPAPGTFDFNSMLQWMTGFFQISLPW